MTGSTQALIGSGMVNTVQNFVAWNIKAQRISNNAGCRHYWNSDGTVSKLMNPGTSIGTDGSPNWYVPTTTGIGSNFWIRFTQTGALGISSWTDSSGNGAAVVSGTWYRMTSSQEWVGIATTTAAPVSVNYTVDIAQDAGGVAGPVVFTSTGNVCSTST